MEELKTITLKNESHISVEDANIFKNDKLYIEHTAKMNALSFQLIPINQVLIEPHKKIQVRI